MVGQGVLMGKGDMHLRTMDLGSPSPITLRSQCCSELGRMLRGHVRSFPSRGGFLLADEAAPGVMLSSQM